MTLALCRATHQQDIYLLHCYSNQQAKVRSERTQRQHYAHMQEQQQQTSVIISGRPHAVSQGAIVHRSSGVSTRLAAATPTVGSEWEALWTEGLWTEGLSASRSLWTEGPSASRSLWTEGLWTEGLSASRSLWTEGLWTEGLSASRSLWSSLEDSSIQRY
ncbi:hypothetical protein EYF80_020065 [Liparis tanakae]|uniref:Uncharacterized protein n=1 Tax=Liparis tanakae TaxID=230148 RepID=A0A4Z2HVT4_9TELE|nr:hypothetical protein EYF80_020065 [Liparis tanakae]